MTWLDLIALLDNDTAADVTPAQARNILNTALGVYGSIYVTGGADTQALTTTPAVLSKFTTNGESNNCTPDATNNQITIDITGTYLVYSHIEGTYTSNGGLITEIYVNDAQPTQRLKATTELSVSGAVEHIGATGIMPLTAADVISLYVSAGANETLTCREAQLGCKLIG